MDAELCHYGLKVREYEGLDVFLRAPEFADVISLLRWLEASNAVAELDPKFKDLEQYPVETHGVQIGDEFYVWDGKVARLVKHSRSWRTHCNTRIGQEVRIY